MVSRIWVWIMIVCYETLQLVESGLEDDQVPDDVSFVNLSHDILIVGELLAAHIAIACQPTGLHSGTMYNIRFPFVPTILYFPALPQHG